MKKLFGIILFVAGLVGSLIFGLEAYQDTESIKVLGAQVTLSQADWTPLIICLGITLIGVVLIASAPPKSKSSSKKKKK